MDNYWDKNKLSTYFLTMANIEAQRLYSKATEACFIHLRSGFTQMAFLDDIKRFIDTQLSTIRSVSSEKECQECLKNIQDVHKNLSIQDQMLRSGYAALHASVQFVKNGDVWGYIVNGVGVVLGGMQMVAGFGVAAASFATGNIIGVGFGAMLVLHGANSTQEGFKNIINHTDDAQGFLKKGYVAGAQFLGFDKKTGEIAYTSMDLLLSAYGMGRLVLKPDTFHLYYYLGSDYVRGIKDMTRLDLGIEIYNDYGALQNLYDETKN